MAALSQGGHLHEEREREKLGHLQAVVGEEERAPSSSSTMGLAPAVKREHGSFF